MKLYPLTYSQKNIWFTEKMYPGTSVANVAGTLRMQLNIDFSILEQAINKFVELNDGMRIRVTEKDGEVYQYVTDYFRFKVEFIDFSNKPIEELYKFEEEQTRDAFDLLDTPLFSFTMIKVSENEGGFYIKTHHLISDAWSMGLIGSKISEYYNKILNNEEIIGQQASYLEHVEKEQEYEMSNKFVKDREYWNNKYQEIPDVTILKPKKSDNLSIVAKRKTFVLPEKLTKKIYEYSKNNRTSIFSMYMAAISMYINRITNKRDINLGTIFLNRLDKKEKNIMGMFVTTVPVKINIDDKKNYGEFCKQVTDEMMSIMRHQRYPFSILQEEIHKKYNTDELLYDIVLSYQNTKFSKQDDINITTRWHFSGYQSNGLTIHINDRDSEQKLIIDYDYLKDLFYDKEIEFLHEHIIRLLWHSIDNPMREIAKIEMISEKEKNKLLYEFNDTEANYPKESNIIDLIERIVNKYPNNVAIEDGEKNFTYSQLWKDIQKVSSYLINNKIINMNVAICKEHSYETIVAILSVIRAGCTYIPIDMKYPKDRIDNIIRMGNIEYFFADKENNSNLFESNKILFIDEILDLNIELQETIEIKPEDIVYIIFTSGSTGVPKGVMVKHQGLVNYIYWADKIYNFNDMVNTYPLYSSLSFDLTVTSIFTPLISGGRIVIYADNNKENAILRIVRENKCNILKLTPAHLNILRELDNKNSNIKRLIVGGEALKSDLCSDITKSFDGKIEIFNEYGPTETVVGCMIYKYNSAIDKKATVLIGKPADNVRLYVLDKNLNLCPVGTVGELYIAGDGVAKGYINNDEETKKRFIKNPYSEGEIIYKTGDLVRWLAKGDMEYCGRADFQIKIRGFRIETEEIEKHINKIDGIKENVVLDIKGKEDRVYLCAYIIADKEIQITKIRNYLNNKIPYYMVPTFYMFIDSMPITQNGKIDRKRLPLPNFDMEENEYIAPKTNVEHILSNMIGEILKLDKVSVTANIFELGMDSLAIIQLQSRLLKHNIKLNTQDFYNSPIIEDLSKKIEEKNSKNENNIELDIINPIVNMKFNKHYSFENILLTGATGFLGIHILDYLITNTEVNVWCLIRGKNNTDSEKRLKKLLNFYFNNKYADKNLERVHIVNGDITLDNLGIKDVEGLLSKIDTVFHCAGLVKHYGTYDEFYNVNVHSTEMLVNFCEKYDKKFNYISTLSVSGGHLTKFENKHIVFDENSFYIGQKYMDNVYVRSKFEAEKTIYKAIQNGLNASIFRVGNLTWRKSDFKYQINKEENAFYGRIKAIYDMKMLPNNLVNTEIEFTPVDECAEAIIKISKEYSDISNVYHIYNNNYLKLSDLISIFNRETKINICSQDEFKQKLAQNMEFTNMFVNDLNDDNLIDYNSVIKYSNLMTNKHLEKVGFMWNLITDDYILKFLESMVECDEIEGKDK